MRPRTDIHRVAQRGRVGARTSARNKKFFQTFHSPWSARDRLHRTTGGAIELRGCCALGNTLGTSATVLGDDSDPAIVPVTDPATGNAHFLSEESTEAWRVAGCKAEIHGQSRDQTKDSHLVSVRRRAAMNAGQMLSTSLRLCMFHECVCKNLSQSANLYPMSSGRLESMVDQRQLQQSSLTLDQKHVGVVLALWCEPATETRNHHNSTLSPLLDSAPPLFLFLPHRGLCFAIVA